MSFVLYKCARVSIDENYDVRFEEIDKMELGVMIDCCVYDITTKEKIPTMNDNIDFGDICLSKLKPFSVSTLSLEDYTSLVLRANEIISERGKN